MHEKDIPSTNVQANMSWALVDNIAMQLYYFNLKQLMIHLLYNGKVSGGEGKFGKPLHQKWLVKKSDNFGA